MLPLDVYKDRAILAMLVASRKIQRLTAPGDESFCRLISSKRDVDELSEDDIEAVVAEFEELRRGAEAHKKVIESLPNLHYELVAAYKETLSRNDPVRLPKADISEFQNAEFAMLVSFTNYMRGYGKKKLGMRNDDLTYKWAWTNEDLILELAPKFLTEYIYGLGQVESFTAWGLETCINYHFEYPATLLYGKELSKILSAVDQQISKKVEVLERVGLTWSWSLFDFARASGRA
ncbi:hypothetical protein BDV98DRAFT_608035 [Pterulicium gracile]|uniref:Uncharacterized protein n=1 Tax=Pterulicium gracile TaxID=1884261 RepID=A0A5C3Q6U3_9AGAR|nr:hypothetical protein BDV98DRAFT_608035 [Pterula gracilis]